MPLSWKRRRPLIQLRCPAWGTNGPNKEVDFVGTAEYGVCSSKAMKYFGLKLHSVVSLTGVVMGLSRYPGQSLREPASRGIAGLVCAPARRVCLGTEPTMTLHSRPFL